MLTATILIFLFVAVVGILLGADRVIGRALQKRRDLEYRRELRRLAMIYPEPDKRGRGNKGKSEFSSEFSQKRLSQARSVLRNSQKLADAGHRSRPSRNAFATRCRELSAPARCSISLT